ncbi:MAG: methylated-DNA--[protein]-cysteine S-methyltransferase [Promethearchaeota archaeon]
MENQYYITFSSQFDTFTVVWEEKSTELKIERIFLSDSRLNSEVKAQESFIRIKTKSSSSIASLGQQIQLFLKGEEIEFDLEMLDFDTCYELQKKVLLAEYKIPRGWVSTYKRIANHLGMPNGARVIGNALSRNPFPIIIPCHRAIRTNGGLGGFQGGIKMKQKLLALEGIEFSDKGKVITDKIYY